MAVDQGLQPVHVCARFPKKLIKTGCNQNLFEKWIGHRLPRTFMDFFKIKSVFICVIPCPVLKEI